MSRKIDYGKLMHQAMRGLIQTVLEDVRDNGLPGAHHFFITFETTHPDAELADWLKERYPTEMTVVMQQWFDDLEVSEDGFSVTLNFGDAPEHLYIPFDAVQTFVDPSVEFGLRFESTDDAEDEGTEGTSETTAEESGEAPIHENAEDTPRAPRDADVVSLDQFRKT